MGSLTELWFIFLIFAGSPGQLLEALRDLWCGSVSAPIRAASTMAGSGWLCLMASLDMGSIFLWLPHSTAGELRGWGVWFSWLPFFHFVPLLFVLADTWNFLPFLQELYILLVF